MYLWVWDAHGNLSAHPGTWFAMHSTVTSGILSSMRNKLNKEPHVTLTYDSKFILLFFSNNQVLDSFLD